PQKPPYQFDKPKSSPNPAILEKHCNLRRRAANSTYKKFLEKGYSALLQDGVIESWAFRPKRGLDPEENLMVNPGMWKRGTIVHSDDCGVGNDECLGIRWRDQTNNRLFTAPRWVREEQLDPRSYGKLDCTGGACEEIRGDDEEDDGNSATGGGEVG
ncbi:unnamed protein product, partial [Amoebophrya sp. A120]